MFEKEKRLRVARFQEAIELLDAKPFDVVVLDEDVPDIRPGFTCTADITTATPTFTNVSFGASSSYATVPAGAYQVRVTAAGSRAGWSSAPSS